MVQDSDCWLLPSSTNERQGAKRLGGVPADQASAVTRLSALLRLEVPEVKKDMMEDVERET